MCRGGGEGPAPHDCHHQSVHLSLCPGPGTVLRGEYASVAGTQPMSWGRSLRNMCAVRCDKCSERDESRRPWHPEEGAPQPCQQRPLGGGGWGVGPLVLKGAEWSRQVKGHWLSGILSLMLPREWLSNLFWTAAPSKKYVLHHKPGHTYV